MRPLHRGAFPSVNGVPKVVKDYGDLREDLFEALDGCCSYCEAPLSAKPEVEHVAPKALHPEARTAWDNLLLACGFCNPEKGTRDIDRSTDIDHLWPDRDNTFCAFVYGEGGVVNPAKLTDDLRNRAIRTRNLVGLNPPHLLSPTDARRRRWRLRRDAWDRIKMAREDLRASDTPAMRRQILAHAKSLGFWSMWMTVFADDTAMRAALLGLYRSIAPGCFDATGNPLRRNGGVL
jgi:hypothetical protein